MVRFTLGLGRRDTSAGEIIRRGEVFGWAALVETTPAPDRHRVLPDAVRGDRAPGAGLAALMEGDHTLGYALMKQLRSCSTSELDGVRRRLTTYALIAAAALVVGLFIGTVGVGGILLIPALTYLGGLDRPHRRGHRALHLRLHRDSRHGAVPAPRLDRLADHEAGVRRRGGLQRARGVGGVAHRRAAARPRHRRDRRVRRRLHPAPAARRERFRDGQAAGRAGMLAGVGAASGFGSGLSGAGGPLFSVPMMVLGGFVPLAAIGDEPGAADRYGGVRDRRESSHTAISTFTWPRGSRYSSSRGVVAGVRLAHAVERRYAAAARRRCSASS